MAWPAEEGNLMRPRPVVSSRSVPLGSIAAFTGALLFASPSALAGQTGGSQPDSCTVGRIASVVIDNGSIFDVEDPRLDERFRWAYRAANALHFRTRERVLRRELLFSPGDCLDPFRLAETERLLRGYDFLSDAEVTSAPLTGGMHEVLVQTRDDWSTRVDLRLRVDGRVRFEGVSVNELNFLGRGQRLGAFFFERDATREYGLSYFTPQLAGTRWNLNLAAGRTRPGTFVREEIAYPFVGEVGRWAGRQSFTHGDELFDYIVGDDPSVAGPIVLLSVREKFFDMAAVRRLGERGGMALLGAGISYHRLGYPGDIEVAPDGDFDVREPADSAQAAAVFRQTEEIEAVRLALLLGHRSVWWVSRRGLESPRGLQDVKLGTEAGIALGRSVPWLADDDMFVTFTLYAGAAAGEGVVIARGRADMRRDFSASSAAGWRDLYADGEILGYWQVGRLPRHTLFLRAAGLGAWSTSTPFQLTLGGERALRGYDVERFPGGRRALITFEHRLYAGWPFGELLDLGTTAFVDAGRMWPGDVPFGSDSGWRYSAGLGLRGAFPAGGRTSYRLDFAWPIERNARLGDLRIRFSIGEPHRLAPRKGDSQILRSRPEGVGGSLFQSRTDQRP